MCWAVLLVLIHSVFGATVVLAVLAGLSIAGVVFLKTMGVTRDHPWLRWMASRPWRDGQDVLKLALRRLHGGAEQIELGEEPAHRRHAAERQQEQRHGEGDRRAGGADPR